MKYKIKIIEIDESVEDAEFHVDFVFLDSKVRYQAELLLMFSEILHSFLGKEITANITLELPTCKQNKEKKNTWLNCRFDSDFQDTWLNPADIEETKELSPRYLCSGKILDIHLNGGSKYYSLESERTIDVNIYTMCREKDSIKQENIQIGEYYTFDGVLRIKSIDEYDSIINQRLGKQRDIKSL